MKFKLKVRGKLLVLLMIFAIIPVAVVAVQALSAMEKARASSMHSVEIAAQTINEVIDRNLFERYGDVQASPIILPLMILQTGGIPVRKIHLSSQ